MNTEPTPVLRIRPADVSPFVLVCGDPERAEKISQGLENSGRIGAWREYHTYTGTYRGLRVTAASHGVGAAGAAVCFEELIRAGAQTIIRIGTCGSYIPTLRAGSLIIGQGATREEGVSTELVRPEYPAVADLDVTYTLRARANARPGVSSTVGILRTHGAFYHGIEPNPHAYWMAAGAVGIEMEFATLLIISAIRRVRAGGIFVVDGNPAEAQDMTGYNPHRQIVEDAKANAIAIALDTLVALAGTKL